MFTNIPIRDRNEQHKQMNLSTRIYKNRGCSPRLV